MSGEDPEVARDKATWGLRFMRGFLYALTAVILVYVVAVIITYLALR